MPEMPLRREDRPDPGDLPVGEVDTLAALGRIIRFGVTLFGVGVMLLGGFLAASLFFELSVALREPEKLQDVVQKWGEVAGGDALSLPTPDADKPLPLARPAGMCALGFAALLLAYLAMGILTCGARIVVWTTDDRKAVKDILDYAWERRRGERGL